MSTDTRCTTTTGTARDVARPARPLPDASKGSDSAGAPKAPEQAPFGAPERIRSVSAAPVVGEQDTPAPRPGAAGDAPGDDDPLATYYEQGRPYDELRGLFRALPSGHRQAAELALDCVAAYRDRLRDEVDAPRAEVARLTATLTEERGHRTLLEHAHESARAEMDRLTAEVARLGRDGEADRERVAAVRAHIAERIDPDCTGDNAQWDGGFRAACSQMLAVLDAPREVAT